MSRSELEQGILSSKANCLPVVFLGIVGSIQISDPIVASLALVKATQSLGFSPDIQAIAASISTLALAATVIPMGVVADKIGRRRLIVLALLLTAVGDVVTATAPNVGSFLVGRAIAGVGLGAVFAGAFGFVRSVVVPTKLSPALGIFAAWCSIPLFIFMPLGSALADVSWRITFLMIPFVSVVCAGLCFRILPTVAPLPPIKREYWGLVALAVGVVGMLIGIGAAAKSLTSPNALIPLAIGLLGLAAFAIIESRAQHAVFPMSLFKSPLFLVGALGGFAWNAASAAAQLLSSNLWQYVSEVSALSASLRQLPIMGASIVASIVAGRIMGRGKSAVAVLVVGGILTTVGMALTGVSAPSPNGLLFSLALIVAFFGCGVMTVPQSQMFVQEAPEDSYGPVTSSRMYVGQLAYAIGLAGGAAIANSVTVSLVVSNEARSDAEATTEVGKFLTSAATTIARLPEYYTQGFSAAMYATAVLVAICTVIIVALGRSAAKRSGDHAAATAAAAATPTGSANAQPA